MLNKVLHCNAKYCQFKGIQLNRPLFDEVTPSHLTLSRPCPGAPGRSPARRCCCGMLDSTLSCAPLFAKPQEVGFVELGKVVSGKLHVAFCRR
jgi:hypothetical protein